MVFHCVWTTFEQIVATQCAPTFTFPFFLVSVFCVWKFWRIFLPVGTKNCLFSNKPKKLNRCRVYTYNCTHTRCPIWTDLGISFGETDFSHPDLGQCYSLDFLSIPFNIPRVQKMTIEFAFKLVNTNRTKNFSHTRNVALFSKFLKNVHVWRAKHTDILWLGPI